MSITYVTSYLSSNKLATRPETITAIVIAAVVGLAATLAWGRLTDRVGRRPVYIIGTSAMLIFGVPMFLMLNTGVFGLIVVTFLISFTICQNSLAGAQGSWFSELFNTNTRSSGAVAGLPALGRRLRLHRLLGRVALLGLRLDRSRGAVHASTARSASSPPCSRRRPSAPPAAPRWPLLTQAAEARVSVSA